MRAAMFSSTTIEFATRIPDEMPTALIVTRLNEQSKNGNTMSAITIVTGIETNATNTLDHSARKRTRMMPVSRTPCHIESKPPRTVAWTYAPSSRIQWRAMPGGSVSRAFSAAVRTRSTTAAAFASPFFVILMITAGLPLKNPSDSTRLLPKRNVATSRR